MNEVFSSSQLDYLATRSGFFLHRHFRHIHSGKHEYNSGISPVIQGTLPEQNPVLIPYFRQGVANQKSKGQPEAV